VAAAARYPEIAEITSSARAEVAVNGRTQELLNTNPLVGNEGWDIRMSKTGSSTDAGRCLTMRMRSGDKDVTVVLLHAENSEQRTSMQAEFAIHSPTHVALHCKLILNREMTYEIGS
jgi:D-alanyl-D-alanine endopeptidase (penicillin-binding protein 7)